LILIKASLPLRRGRPWWSRCLGAASTAAADGTGPQEARSSMAAIFGRPIARIRRHFLKEK
jgi:hypothetical protein